MPQTFLLSLASLLATLAFSTSAQGKPDRVGASVTSVASGSISAEGAVTDLWPSAKGCEALTGPNHVQRSNQRWREARIGAQHLDGDRWELWVTGISSAVPQTRTFEGASVVGVSQTADGWQAQVELKGALQRNCGTDRVSVRLDDSFGRGQRVVGLHHDGLLLAAGSELLFVPVAGVEEAPDFDVVYRSTFRITTPLAPHILKNGRGLGRRRR